MTNKDCLAFVQRWWKWAVIAIVITASFFLGRSGRVVITTKKSETEEKEDATVAEKEADLQKRYDQSVKDAKNQYDEDKKQVVDMLVEHTEEIKDEPSEVTDWLLDVGKRQRQ